MLARREFLSILYKGNSHMITWNKCAEFIKIEMPRDIHNTVGNLLFMYIEQECEYKFNTIMIADFKQQLYEHDFRVIGDLSALNLPSHPFGCFTIRYYKGKLRVDAYFGQWSAEKIGEHLMIIAANFKQIKKNNGNYIVNM